MMDSFGVQDMGWMMVAGSVFWVLILALVVLAIAALIKYLRSGGARQ